MEPLPCDSQTTTSTSSGAPLCVDLDGTLIVGDTLRLSLRALLVTKPWVFFYLPFRVLCGRAVFKESVSRMITLDPRRLPYREPVLSFLKEQKTAGRRLILVTAANHAIAQSVAGHLDLFDGVVASDERRNVKGINKVSAIREYLKGGEFDYIGDSSADLPVFRAARQSILVHPSNKLLAAAARVGRVQKVFH